MTEQITKRFVDVKGVAEYLSFTEPTIRAWIRLGKIPFYKIGRGVRFDLSEIDRWADKKKCVDFSNKPRLFHILSWMGRSFSDFN